MQCTEKIFPFNSKGRAQWGAAFFKALLPLLSCPCLPFGKIIWRHGACFRSSEEHRQTKVIARKSQLIHEDLGRQGRPKIQKLLSHEWRGEGNSMQPFNVSRSWKFIHFKSNSSPPLSSQRSCQTRVKFKLNQIWTLQTFSTKYLPKHCWMMSMNQQQQKHHGAHPSKNREKSQGKEPKYWCFTWEGPQVVTGTLVAALLPCEAECTTPKLLNPKSKTRNSKPDFQSPKSKIQVPISTIQNLNAAACGCPQRMDD